MNDFNPLILLIPFIAGFIGWFTNWLAVKATLYPVEFVGLPYNQTNVFASTGGEANPQTMVEAFYRIQLTESMQLTPDIQVIFNPGAGNDNDVSVVLGLRLTTDF